jgi:DNA-binding CsgD family transcriptional regulator
MAMRDLQSVRRTLAELLDSHEELVGQGRDTDKRPPRLRLQDWHVVDRLSSDSTEYVILRRVHGREQGSQPLTIRERDVVCRACAGYSNKEIAHQMNISSSTVRVLVSRACRKVSVANRNQLIRHFSKHSDADLSSR